MQNKMKQELSVADRVNLAAKTGCSPDDLALIVEVKGEFPVPYSPCFLAAFNVRDFELLVRTNSEDCEPLEVTTCEVHLMLTSQMRDLLAESDNHSAPLYAAVRDLFDGRTLNPHIKSLYGRIRNRNILLIDGLCVKKEYRSMGIGTLLVESIQTLAVGLAGLLVAVPYLMEFPPPKLCSTEEERASYEAAYDRDLQKVNRLFVRSGFRAINDDTMTYSMELAEQPSIEGARKVRAWFEELAENNS